MFDQKNARLCRYMYRSESIYECKLAEQANMGLAKDIRKKLLRKCSELDRFNCPLWMDREPPQSK